MNYLTEFGDDVLEVFAVLEGIFRLVDEAFDGRLDGLLDDFVLDVLQPAEALLLTQQTVNQLCDLVSQDT